jgi:multiple sugar transport system ATP-binding protein
MASVRFENVQKVFSDGTRAVRDFSLEVADGEFAVLVGPSGCGKTTLLRLVAGLEDLTDGDILIGERIVNDVDARGRDVAMVFQNYALYPHYNVYGNIAFGLRVRGVPRSQVRQRVESIARVLGLQDLLERKPRQLSGGQRQRVAMGRAIVREPQVFLMDEPLSNLDAKLRVQMRAHISRIQRELGATTIYVTHDQVEAMTMGDRVAVLRAGELQQVGPPQVLYEEPANLFVASFIGSPAMNILESRIVRANGGLGCDLGGNELALGTGPHALERYAGRAVAVGVRPEHLRAANGAPPSQLLRGRIVLSEAVGPEDFVHVEVSAVPVLSEDVLDGVVGLDEAAVFDLRSEARERRTTVVCRFAGGSRVIPGDEIDLELDASRLHFFDLETGRAIR